MLKAVLGVIVAILMWWKVWIIIWQEKKWPYSSVSDRLMRESSCPLCFFDFLVWIVQHQAYNINRFVHKFYSLPSSPQFKFYFPNFFLTGAYKAVWLVSFCHVWWSFSWCMKFVTLRASKGEHRSLLISCRFHVNEINLLDFTDKWMSGIK